MCPNRVSQIRLWLQSWYPAILASIHCFRIMWSKDFVHGLELCCLNIGWGYPPKNDGVISEQPITRQAVAHFGGWYWCSGFVGRLFRNDDLSCQIGRLALPKSDSWPILGKTGSGCSKEILHKQVCPKWTMCVQSPTLNSDWRTFLTYQYLAETCTKTIMTYKHNGSHEN